MSFNLFHCSLTYEAGSNVSFMIDMRNGRDKSINTGGDEIRVWLKDLDNQRNLAAQVRDLGNGSHLASVSLPWVGTYE